MKDLDCQPESGAALVITVIVVAVLAVVTVAFMQTSGTDRLSSRTVADHYKARLAAEAGAADALATVADLVARYPDSVTVWQNIGSGGPDGTNNEATVLYMRARSANTNLGATPGEFGANIVLLGRPLVSGASNVALANLANAMPFNVADMVNINATNSATPQPSVGLRSMINHGAPVAAAKWIYMTDSEGKTNARYAFWVEDESFKVNLNVLTNGVRGSTDFGGWPGEGRIDGSLGSSTNDALEGADFASIVRNKPGGNYPTPLTALLVAAITNADAAAELRFLAATESAGLDLSRGGFKRFNINTVTNGVSSPTDINVMRTNLDRVVAAITNTNAAPLFGQRFYRIAGLNMTNTVSDEGTNRTVSNHGLIYVNKIAANIMDYIDVDSQPVILNNDGIYSVLSGRPDYGIEALGGGTDGTNSTVAVGIENLPRLQEYAIHARIRRMNPIGFHTNSPPVPLRADYEVSIDHYLEFWNPGTNDIRLGADAFLKIYDQPAYGTNGGVSGPLGIYNGRPMEVPLLTNGQQVVFPAGKVTVLTTAPTNEINETLVRDRSNLAALTLTDSGDRIFSGTTTETNIRSPLFNGFNRLFSVAMQGRSGANGWSDYQSAVLLGNNLGILDSFVGLPIPTPGGSFAIHMRVTNNSILDSIGNSAANIANGNLFYVRGGSLRGNAGVGTAGNPRSTEGDPRTLNEQLAFINHSGGANDADETRFYDSDSRTADIPTGSTLGLPNTNYVAPSRWVDMSSMDPTAADAPLAVANAKIASIGELGHITDPARVPGSVGTLTSIIYSRGGGRTLRVGQPELSSWYDGNQTNASRTWTSWRLADIFTTTNAISIPGLINPNGALRDNGAAVRALFHGMTMLPTTAGAPTTAGNPVAVNTLVTDFIARLTNASPASSGLPAGALNPLWERGELSELAIFATGSALTGANLAQTIDRGREEIVRRSVQMITTRGSVFTVHTVGQAVRVSATATNVLSTARLRTTFEISPDFSDWNAATNDAFSPENATNRFAAPTNYSVKTLNSFHD